MESLYEIKMLKTHFILFCDTYNTDIYHNFFSLFLLIFFKIWYAYINGITSYVGTFLVQYLFFSNPPPTYFFLAALLLFPIRYRILFHIHTFILFLYNHILMNIHMHIHICMGLLVCYCF